MKETHDMMASADRPGRCFSQNELGMGNPQRSQNAKRGIRYGGHWYGVKSLRTALPWIRDTEFTPAQLRQTLKRGGKFYWRDGVLLSAAAFVRSERQRKEGR